LNSGQKRILTKLVLERRKEFDIIIAMKNKEIDISLNVYSEKNEVRIAAISDVGHKYFNLKSWNTGIKTIYDNEVNGILDELRGKKIAFSFRKV
jgi:hypothetical protein